MADEPVEVFPFKKDDVGQWDKDLRPKVVPANEAEDAEPAPKVPPAPAPNLPSVGQPALPFSEAEQHPSAGASRTILKAVPNPPGPVPVQQTSPVPPQPPVPPAVG